MIPALQQHLFIALRPLEAHREYTLLGYPDHPNIGDHIIWLGTLQYLSLTARARLLATPLANTPILLAGGGNLGDIWPAEEQFRQSIIQRYPDRPVFILPQTIHFQDESNARAAATVYNAHPDLTLYVRDRVSLAIAETWFPKVRLHLAPDMAFALHPLPKLPHPPPQSPGILFHCRDDKEFRATALPPLPGLVAEEWSSYGRHWGLRRWRSRRSWMALYPAAFQPHEGQPLHRRSWAMLHDGAYQLARYPRFITNRLHGHILALLMDIPHILLPGNYHKIEAFSAAWTASIPPGRFCADGSHITAALD